MPAIIPPMPWPRPALRVDGAAGAAGEIALPGGSAMPAYFIVDNEVTDPAGFEEYRKQVPTTLELYGGKILVRGGQLQTLEGDWKPTRLVVTEFPSIEQARRWYDSEEYRPLKALRLRTARGSLGLVEGVAR
jgi:uncharacterized protein (DUF1330 family)